MHQPAPLVGRSESLAAAAAALDRVASASGGALDFTGPRGVGKTAMLRAVRDLAVERGMIVVSIDVSEWEQIVPWSTLWSVIAPFRRIVGQLPNDMCRALTSLDPALSRGASPVEWFEAAVAVLNLLSHAATERPVVLIIDDLDVADESSRAALASVVRRISAESVLLVSARNSERSDESLLATTIALAPLTPSATTELLIELGVTDAGVQQPLADAARGVPAALVELVGKLSPQQKGGLAELPNPLVSGSSIEFWYEHRLAGLADRERNALVVVAADTSGDWGLVMAALEHLGESKTVLEASEELGVIRVEEGRIHFDHPLARSVLYHGATPPARRRAHAALAAVEPDGDCAIWHQLRGVLGRDADVADAVADLAERTSSTGALGTAGDLYRSAARLTPDAQRRASRWLSAANLAMASASPRRARLDLDEVPVGIRQSDGTIAVMAATIDARLAVADGDLPAALSIVQAAVADALADPTVGCDRVADMAFAVIGPAIQVGRTDIARRLSRQVAKLLEEPGDTLPAATHALARIARGIAGAAFSAEDDADLGAWSDLLAARGPSASGLLCETVATIYMFTGRKTLSLEMLDELEIVARAACSTGGLIPVLVVRAANAFARDFPAAVRLADEAIELAGETGQPGLARPAWQTLVLSLAGQIDEVRCRAVADAILNGGRGPRTLAVAALARLELSLGRPEEAIAVLAQLADDPATVRGPLFYHADLAEAFVRAGRSAEAEAPLAVLAAQAGTGDRWAAGQVARVNALMTDGDAACPLFESARDEFLTIDNLYAAALTELQWGEHLRRMRRRGQARPLLESARSRFELIGATGWLARTDRELVAAGAAGPPLEQSLSATSRLTASELEIARRVAAGDSNRDVARQLFVSPRTVQTHLSAIYRKLGVNGRPGLAMRARDDSVLR